MNDRSGAAPTSAATTSPHKRDELLVVEDLHTSFSIPAGEVKAVAGVSFTLGRGRTIGIVGESGSGKTVLSRSIMRLNLGSNVTTTGSARYDGQELLDLPLKKMRDLWGAHLAMVFQDPMTSLNPTVRIGRQITEHLRHHLDYSKSESAETAINLLKEVRIPEADARFAAYPHELSGGMRQRVAIAIALACGPRILFADEPTTALDVTVQHQILNLLAREQRDRDMGMLLVTHDLGVVAGRADEIAVMYAGKIVEKAPTKALFDDVRMPYTEALLRSIPRVSLPNHTRLAAISGRPPDLVNPAPGCAFAPRCPYAQPVCGKEEPPLVEASPGHSYRCHFPVGSDENRIAYERNLAAGRPSALSVQHHENSLAERSSEVEPIFEAAKVRV